MLLTSVRSPRAEHSAITARSPEIVTPTKVARHQIPRSEIQQRLRLQVQLRTDRADGLGATVDPPRAADPTLGADALYPHAAVRTLRPVVVTEHARCREQSLTLNEDARGNAGDGRAHIESQPDTLTDGTD